MKTEDISEKLDGFIHKLDEASGRLIVAAREDTAVFEAWRMITDVSFDLGELIYETESDE